DRDMQADNQTDRMDWDYKTYKPHNFDVIWASPTCTEYSMAKTTGVRKIEEANKISQRTIDIIRYFDPKYWIIENPQTGRYAPRSKQSPYDGGLRTPILVSWPGRVATRSRTLITVSMACLTVKGQGSGTTSSAGTQDR
ncbi:MAG: hypothetical protein ACKPKO_12820, partial [Candidatus Fonsibacter sp.]